MSIYNLLLGYKSSVVPPGGDIGFSDNTPGNNKSYKLPYFNTIKIEIWGAGGGGGGGDHSNEYDGGSGGTSKITTFNVVVGGGGGGTGGNNNGTKTGSGGGGGVASGSYSAGTITLYNGNSGTNAVDGQPGLGGDSPSGGKGGIPSGGSSGSTTSNIPFSYGVFQTKFFPSSSVSDIQNYAASTYLLSGTVPITVPYTFELFISEFFSGVPGASASDAASLSSSIYTNILGRKPDTDGLHYWYGQYLSKGSSVIGQVAGGATEAPYGDATYVSTGSRLTSTFYNAFQDATNISNAAKSDFIDRTTGSKLKYGFNRKPDVAGLQYWYNLHITGGAASITDFISGALENPYGDLTQVNTGSRSTSSNFSSYQALSTASDAAKSDFLDQTTVSVTQNTSGGVAGNGYSPGGGGSGNGYENGAVTGPGSGKKSGGGGAIKDSAGGGGGGGGAYALIQFNKTDIPQRTVINYDVGVGGNGGSASYSGGNGANGKIKITWT